MNKPKARYPDDDQPIIDELIREKEDREKVIDKLHKENSQLKKDLDKIRKEFDEYRVRHPENVGVKNGKPYEYRMEKG